MNSVAFKIVIYGKVQGIGFRWFVKNVADEEKIFGYVKNNFDGSVEVVAEAKNINLINKFIERIKTEHPYALVNKISINEIGVSDYRSFNINF
ncbi:MAG: acylphosphatase [Endomicrobia bacterium]|nr:acylphosphatase [Endomicrobiia bacterium]